MPTIINSDLSNWNCQYLLHFYFGIILVEIIWSEGDNEFSDTLPSPYNAINASL